MFARAGITEPGGRRLDEKRLIQPYLQVERDGVPQQMIPYNNINPAARNPGGRVIWKQIALAEKIISSFGESG